MLLEPELERLPVRGKTAQAQPDRQRAGSRICQQPKLSSRLSLPATHGALEPAQPALTLGAKIEHLEQTQQIVALQRLGQGGQHVETRIVQETPGAVYQGLIMSGEQDDGQTAVVILGMAHQQADGILLRQAEITDKQSHAPSSSALRHPSPS